MTMKRYIQSVFGLLRAYQLRFFRDKTALFFTFLFPLIFLFVFGAISSNGDISFKVAVLNNSKTEFATRFIDGIAKDGAFTINKDITSLDDAKLKMSRGEIDSVIELPASFGVINTTQQPSGTLVVHVQKGSEQSGQTVAAVMQSALDGINKGLGRPEPLFRVEQQVSNKHGLSSFDYTFAGLLGFTLMSMGIFGLATAMPQENQTGAFRRLRASPFRASQLIVANALHYLLIASMSAALMIVIGIMVFDLSMRGNWAAYVSYIIISAFMLQGFGLVVGAWAKNENQASPLANLISFPMMFLSGVFFPRFLFPEWLQDVTAFVPLTPVVEGLRRIATENTSLIDLAPELGLIAIWTVLVYVIAIRLFRWE